MAVAIFATVLGDDDHPAAQGADAAAAVAQGANAMRLGVQGRFLGPTAPKLLRAATRRRGPGIASALILGLVLTSLVSGLIMGPPPPTPPPAPEVCQARSRFYVSRSRAVQEQLTRLIGEGDRLAFARLAQSHAVKLAPGTRLYVEEAGLFSGLWQIRVAGTLQTYWTLREEIECQWSAKNGAPDEGAPGRREGWSAMDTHQIGRTRTTFASCEAISTKRLPVDNQWTWQGNDDSRWLQSHSLSWPTLKRRSYAPPPSEK
jgi:hypothetical protein